MVYSSTTVLPADVWALRNTDWLRSNLNTACFWHVSNSNGYTCSGLESIASKLLLGSIDEVIAHVIFWF